MKDIKEQVAKNADRVAKLGGWPPYIQPSSLLDRIPTAEQARPGFDAGIACALDLIPRPYQKLSATLHANYTPEAVAQVRTEVEQLKVGITDTETCWWLLACSLCTEEQMPEQLEASISEFKHLASEPTLVKQEAAIQELGRMFSSFVVIDGVAWATRDGGAQAAYLDGYDLAVAPSKFGLFFVSTFKESLGIPEDFPWHDPPTPDNPMSNSGPVHGSKQFVKADSLEELLMVVSVARETLGIKGAWDSDSNYRSRGGLT